MWGALLPVIGQVLGKVLPDPAAAAEAKIRLAELVQRGELAFLDADVKVALGQMEINKEEAKSGSLFVAGWRPAVGWICAVALSYQFVVRPLLAWYSLIVTIPVPPELDVATLMTLLFGMLGMGGMRMYEKSKGVARDKL
jgi:hypothetical protein